MPVRVTASEEFGRLQVLAAKLSNEGQQDLLRQLAEDMTGELVQIGWQDVTGNLRRGVTLCTLPQKCPGGWYIGIGDLSILGNPSERAPGGTISAFLDWYRETYEPERKARQREAVKIARAKTARAQGRPRKRVKAKRKPAALAVSEREAQQREQAARTIEELIEVEKEIYKPESLLSGEAISAAKMARIVQLQSQRSSLTLEVGRLSRAVRDARSDIGSLQAEANRERYSSVGSPERARELRKQAAEIQARLAPYEVALEEQRRQLERVESELRKVKT